MLKLQIKKILRKVWHFIWENNSIWSWIVNIILAFIFIKFIIYPGLAFILSTSHPIVAVVSESMKHDSNFDEWWEKNKEWYLQREISKEEFEKFDLKNGFNKGDIMVLVGNIPEKIKIGDILVFKSKKKDPIIHRVVKKYKSNGKYYFQTKGDNNKDSMKNVIVDETTINENSIIGKAVFKIPLFGYIKIWFVESLKNLGLLD